VIVHTAAGATEIPVLPDAEAAHVRDRIAGLIRRPDDL
jgi:membrane protein YdbS with pleckstrin-like domain